MDFGLEKEMVMELEPTSREMTNPHYFRHLNSKVGIYLSIDIRMDVILGGQK